MSGTMRKGLPRAASADPAVLRAQLAASLAALGAGEDPARLHALVDGAVHHLVEAAIRGDRAAVDAMAAALHAAAEEVPALGVSPHDAARYRLAVLPRVADVVARLAPGAAIEVLARAPEGAPVWEALAVLAREAAGGRQLLRAGEVHARGAFTVGERRVGQVLAELRDAGWLVQVVRNVPGPVAHYALSPVGEERAAAMGVGKAAAAARPVAARPAAVEPAAAAERFTRYPKLLRDPSPPPVEKPPAARPRRLPVAGGLGARQRRGGSDRSAGARG